MFYVSDSLLEEWMRDIKYNQVMLGYKQAMAAGCQEDYRARVRLAAQKFSMTGDQAIALLDCMEQQLLEEQAARLQSQGVASGRRRVWNTKKRQWEEVKRK